MKHTSRMTAILLCLVLCMIGIFAFSACAPDQVDFSLGFEVDDKKLKRAGLDYWDKLDITYYDGLADFNRKHPDAQIFYFTTKGKHLYTEVKYPEEVYIMFGKESAGLPEELLFAHPEQAVRLPMRPTLRSLNLSNTVAVAVFEILRQHDFAGLCTEGELTKYDWNDAT